MSRREVSLMVNRILAAIAVALSLLSVFA
jgi:hypothetical protein